MLISSWKAATGKKKIHILQTWVIVVERRIVLFPVVNCELNQVVSSKHGVSDVVLFLQEVENGQSLMLETCANHSVSSEVLQIHSPGPIR